MASTFQVEKEAVLAISREMYRKGLVVGSAGNVSMRLKGARNLLAITPSRRPYEDMTENDIQIIDFEAEPVEGELVPSLETMLHVAIYCARPEVKSVVHTHSVYATAFAVAHQPVPAVMDEMIALVGGDVQVAEYAFPSSDELAHNAAEGLVDRNAVLLSNHGVVGIGVSPREALTVCELVERAAQVHILARLVGKAHPLPEDIVALERAFFKMANSPDPNT